MYFHISCCGRSGSKFMAKALNNMGVPTIHEMGDDWPFPSENGVKFFAANPQLFSHYSGIIGWKWSIITPVFASRPKKQLHMVRNPLTAIESATTHADSLFSMIERNLGRPDLKGHTDSEVVRLGRAINYWIRYNKQFDQGKYVFQVEQVKFGDAHFDNLCDYLEIKSGPRELVKYLDTAVNERKKAKRRIPVSLDIIKQYFPHYVSELTFLAEKYGYGLS